jgi:putative SOS response-associated peptidase YedK
MPRMCGRFASQLPPEILAQLFRTRAPLVNAAPSWNVAPTDSAMVVRRDPQDGARDLGLLQWGLVPHFTKELKAARRPINARAETLAGSAMFRGALAQRRCLVPAGAFYEWRHVDGTKQPYAVARADGAPLALAGLWEGWRDPTSGEILRSFVIVTTAANADLAWLHDRMPVILEPRDWPLWLGEEAGEAAALLMPAGAGIVRVWPVSRAVNSVRNNGPLLLSPLAEAAGPRP